MRTSEYMDKQITELSRSRSFDFSDRATGGVLDGYDSDERDSYSFAFHPTQSLRGREEATSFNEALLSLIERKMKEQGDIVLHAVEGVSARLTQLETRTRHLENTIDDLRESFEINHGRTDCKLRELENLLREVQGCTRDLRDKDDIAQAQLQILKLQIAKSEAQQEKQESSSSTQTDLTQQNSLPAPRQPLVPVAAPVGGSQQSHSSLPYAPPNPPPPNFSPVQMATPPQPPAELAQHVSLPTSQHGLYNQPTMLTPNTTNAQYNILPFPHSDPKDPLPYLVSQQEPPFGAGPPQLLPPHSQMAQLPPPNAVATQTHHQFAQIPNIPSHNYPTDGHALSGMAFTNSPIHQFDSTFPSSHDQLTNRPYSGFSGGYSAPQREHNFNQLDPRGKYHSQGINSFMETSFSPVPAQLPVARTLPHALPTASPIESNVSSGETGNRTSIDGIIDKVVAMGFRRDAVRATVNRLEARGQPLELNVVLDALMNGREFH